MVVVSIQGTHQLVAVSPQGFHQIDPKFVKQLAHPVPNFFPFPSVSALLSVSVIMFFKLPKAFFSLQRPVLKPVPDPTFILLIALAFILILLSIHLLAFFFAPRPL